MANWGIQEPEIGWIGMGILFESHKYLKIENDKEEQRVVVRYNKNEPITYHITGLWLKGEQFPISLSPTDWFQRVENTIR